MGETDKAQTQPAQADWSFTIELSSPVIRDDEYVVVSSVVAGVDDPAAAGYTFRYSWGALENGSSLGGNSGMPNSDVEWGFIPPATGRFLLAVECFAPDGTSKHASSWVTVESPDSFHRPEYPGDDAETVIDVDDVSMIFNIASEQFNSLKEYFIALTKGELKFKEFRALNHISFEVKRGEAFGLVGTNGSGKSTMLKVIAGVLDASEGSCTVSGTIAPLIELGAGFDMELTARENIYLNGALLGYKKEFVEDHFQEIVDFAELEGFMDMPLKNYSSGMVARIAFAIATITEPDVLIVDETLSVGDFLFQRKCEQRIKELVESKHVTVLLVSHSIELVERICDRVCWIEKGQQKMLGGTDEVCAAYRSYGM